MDSVELARRAAAGLHARGVALGRDPWKPYEFAVAEAAGRGVDVEGTMGTTVLDGARATYIARDGLIIHEKIGTPFQQAFLVAHEIGHIELGDDPDAGSTLEIDPARSAEPSPVGIDRVVDYGRRQRREVQMDLFARELLLPRHVAYRLHVDEEMTASDIAARLGAPFEVVAQQLLDALLLPVIEVEAAEKRERLLNPLQQAAVDQRGLPHLLGAGPGTGKTQTLTCRVQSLLAEGVDPRRILVLTFSNKAARELSDRIALKNKDAAAAMWIGTFHAFGLDIIRRFHAELGLPADPRMMDRTEAVELLEAEFPRLGLVHYRNIYDPTQIIMDMLSAISRAKDEVVDEKRYAELAAEMQGKAMLPDAPPEALKAAEQVSEVARVYAAYEGLKARARCVDFGDLVSLPVKLLENDPSIRAHMRDKYDHVLVDEYQDVNRGSVRLLAALRRDGENLWAVGDAKQSIYRFRGASSFNMARFGTSDFAGGTTSELEMNYRSVPEVVDAYSTFARDMAVGDGSRGLHADRGSGGYAPEIRTVDVAPQQTVAVADAIEEMRAAGHRYRDQAILCPGNERMSSLGQDLERLGIPVLFLGSLFERPEVKDLLAILSLLADRRSMGLVRTACLPDFTMQLADVAAVLEELRLNDGSQPGWPHDPSIVKGVSGEGMRSLAALAAALGGWGPESSPWLVLAKLLLDRTRMAARLAGSVSVTDRTRGIAIWQFLNFIRVQPAGHGLPIFRLLNRVRRLVRLGDDRDLRQLPAAALGLDAVRLMTIHGAKGLEFPVVHVVGMNAGTLPRTPPPPPCPIPDGMVEGGEGTALEIFRAGQAEEQECLFYVALSRARDRLFLYAPTRNAAGARRAISPFLKRMGLGVSSRHVSPSRALPPADEDAAIRLAIEGGLSFSAQQISLYESCPRRFFYTHVLRVGGRRTATSFTQMHDAVRTVFQAVVSDAGTIGDGPDLERRVADACILHGLGNHGYFADYRNLALGMLRFFLSTRDGHTPEAAVALRLTIGAEEITFLPDDVLVNPEGKRTLRRVQTGHHRSGESDDVGAAAFILAARQAFPEAVTELVHLSDLKVRSVEFSAQQLANRHKKIAKFLVDIRAGAFPADPSSRTCPGCPAFFICGPTPQGTLQKKF